MKHYVLLLSACLFALTGCQRNMDSTSYTSGDSMGVVVEGVIVSARPVTINEQDRLQDNGAGALGGAVMGGVAGNAIGGGSGRTAATAGGAIAGALAGALIQSALSKSEGMEYIVKIDKDNLNANSKTDKTDVSIGGNSVANKIKNSIDTNMKSNMVSVVQGNDVIYNVGQHVYVIYNNGKARLTAAAN